MSDSIQINQAVMVMQNVTTDKGTLIPIGTRGVVTGTTITTENMFKWEQSLYICNLEGYPTVDFKCSRSGIGVVPDGEFFVIVDVLSGNIYNDYENFTYKTIDEARNDFTKKSKRCGFYTVAICDQNLQVVEWICWSKNANNSDDENRYYLGAYIDQETEMLNILKNTFGYYLATDLNDFVNWLHNEKAWKSGKNMAILEARSLHLIAIIPPPPNTPANGIIAHDFEAISNSFGSNYGDDGDGYDDDED